MSVCRSKRATSDSSAGLVPSSSSAAGRSSVIRLRRSPIAVVICSSAPSIAPVMRVASPLRRAPDRSMRRPASCCSVSSCSSRAQRVRSASDASIARLSASSLAFCAVATAVAALAANACKSRSSSSLNGRSPWRRSITVSVPTVRLRKIIGATIRSPSWPGCSPACAASTYSSP